MEHFKDVFNKEEPENPITSDADCGFEFNDIVDEIAVNKPALDEVREARKGLTNGKAPVINSLTAAELLIPNAKFYSSKKQRPDDKNMESRKDFRGLESQAYR